MFRMLRQIQNPLAVRLAGQIALVSISATDLRLNLILT